MRIKDTPAKAAFEFARTSYMLALRGEGKTNQQIANMVGLSYTSVVKLIGYQPEEISKKSMRRGAKKATRTKKLNEIKMIDHKIVELQQYRDLRMQALGSDDTIA